MTFPSASYDPAYRIFLALAQYPVLRDRIRGRMRTELFARGVLTPQEFETRVREYALTSQEREGLIDPFGEEAANVWDRRLERVRSHLTDHTFANSLSYELFTSLVRETLAERGYLPEDMLVAFNPELAPLELLFEQAAFIEELPPEECDPYAARLREIKVVLIRNLISDQLAYVNIAKDWLTIGDLREIRVRKIGHGKVGGKAAGMLLARRILLETAKDNIRERICIPDSYYLGADVMYTFMAFNHLMHWNDQKYQDRERIYSEFPQIQADFQAGQFPADILEKFTTLLEEIGRRPLIVRSSSLLEDNFGTSFAGKYESYFCPNQGTLEENMTALAAAITQVYASVLNPNALLYRMSKGLEDYDERIGVLIQVVQGEEYRRYFLPQVAGVAFGRNLYRWSPDIRREDGFLRLVWGLGTRAVDRVGSDYPRLVALSHPFLRPEATPQAIRRYSQQQVDLIDLEANSFETRPVSAVIDGRYPPLRYIAEAYQDDFLAPIRAGLYDGAPNDLVVTFSEALRRTPLAERMRTILHLLEDQYRLPVDMEFTAQVDDSQSPPEVNICILQCRPQSHLEEQRVHLPKSLQPDQIVFATRRIVPHGEVHGIRYVVFVTAEGYFNLPSLADRTRLVRAIGRVNERFEGESFICLGPGRWGTSNADLGVRVGYADIYHARALVEVSGEGVGPAPEPSFGTHFFQDLIEAQIYPLAVYLDDPDTVLNRDFLYQTPNLLAELVPKAADLADALRVIQVDTYRPGHTLSLVMDDEEGQAVAYLAPDH